MELADVLKKLNQPDLPIEQKDELFEQINKVENAAVREEFLIFLRKQLKGGNNTSIRNTTIKDLGQLRDEQSFETIEQLLRDPDAGITDVVAIIALIKINEEKALQIFPEILASQPDHVKRTVNLEFIAIGVASAGKTYLPGLKNKNLLDCLLKVFLTDHDSNVIKKAAWLISLLGYPETIAPLMEVFNRHKDDSVEANQYVRADIIYSVGELKTKQALQTVVMILQTDPGEEVRVHAVSSLGDHGNPSFETLLVKTLLDDKQFISVRGQAVQALDRLKIYTPQVRQALLQVLNETEEYQDDFFGIVSIADNAHDMLKEMDKAATENATNQ